MRLDEMIAWGCLGVVEEEALEYPTVKALDIGNKELSISTAVKVVFAIFIVEND
jgi:hypothetical protein